MKDPSTRFLVIHFFLELKSKPGSTPKPPSILGDFRERSLFTQLLQGLVRYDRLLEEEIKRRLLRNKKLQKSVSAILKLGIFELLFMEKIPARASLHQAGWLSERFRVKAAKPMINGILRKLLEELDQGYDPKMTHSFEIYHSFPSWMLERWKTQYGEHQALELCQFSNQFQGVHLLLHDPEKQNLVLNEFSDLSFAYEPHAVIPRMFVLHDGKGFIKTKAFQKGWISVIDPSSVLFMLWAAPFFQGKVLDVCAAPGGKSLMIAALGKVDSLYLNDVSRHRIKRIQENIQRTGISPSAILQSDGEKLPFDKHHFDTVLIDAPCSSTGTIQKNPDIKWTASEKTLLKHLELQRQLLDEGARILKPGGTLIYSTCSLEEEENQNQVESFLARHTGFFMKKRPSDSAFFELDDWTNEDHSFFQILTGSKWGGFFGAAISCDHA